MGKEFSPYTEALELKELGFDEECFAMFMKDSFKSRCWCKNSEFEDKVLFTSAPTFSQAFRWFREKYNASPLITCYSELGNAWKYHIPNEGGEQGFNTYEEAELACLKQLIKIVKNQTKN
jgi:hypothetical protein